MIEGFRHLPGKLDDTAQRALIAELKEMMLRAPPYTPRMPRTGRPLSVQMTNCGALGWVSDQAKGYRYETCHPVTGAPWPAMPDCLLKLWREVAAYPALPEACLVNLYAAGARMGSHADRDEADRLAPVVSISLGNTAVFHVGGPRRDDPKQRVHLESGDVCVLAGPAREAYHGVDRVLAGTSRVLAASGVDAQRINLTLRRVSQPPGGGAGAGT